MSTIIVPSRLSSRTASNEDQIMNPPNNNNDQPTATSDKAPSNNIAIPPRSESRVVFNNPDSANQVPKLNVNESSSSSSSSPASNDTSPNPLMAPPRLSSQKVSLQIKTTPINIKPQPDMNASRNETDEQRLEVPSSDHGIDLNHSRTPSPPSYSVYVDMEYQPRGDSILGKPPALNLTKDSHAVVSQNKIVNNENEKVSDKVSDKPAPLNSTLTVPSQTKSIPPTSTTPSTTKTPTPTTPTTLSRTMTLLAPTVTRVQVSPEVFERVIVGSGSTLSRVPTKHTTVVSTTTTPPPIPDVVSSSTPTPKQPVTEIQPPVHPFNSQRVITTASVTSPLLSTPLSTTTLQQQSQSPVMTKSPTTPTSTKQPVGINLGNSGGGKSFWGARSMTSNNPNNASTTVMAKSLDNPSTNNLSTLWTSKTRNSRSRSRSRGRDRSENGVNENENGGVGDGVEVTVVRSLRWGKAFNGNSIGNYNGGEGRLGTSLDGAHSGGVDFLNQNEKVEVAVPGPIEVSLALRKCIMFIEEFGMYEEGLYRVSGSTESIDQLKKRLYETPSSIILKPSHSLVQSISPKSPTTSTSRSLSLSRRKSGTRSKSQSPIRRPQSPPPPIPPVSPSTSGGFKLPVVNIPNKKSINGLFKSNNGGININFGGGGNNNKHVIVIDDVNVVSGVVKAMLREGRAMESDGSQHGVAKGPVIPFELYQEFVDAASSPTMSTTLPTLLQKLPPKNHKTLTYLLQHLSKITKSPHTKMSSRNLGVVLGPGLFKPPAGMDTLEKCLNDSRAWCVVLQWLIESVGEGEGEDGDGEGMVETDQVVKVIVTNESNETLVINDVDNVRDVEVVKASRKKSSGGSVGGGGGIYPQDSVSNVGVNIDNDDNVRISKISIAEAVVNGSDNNDGAVSGSGTGTPSSHGSCNSVEAVVGVMILGVGLENPPGVRVNSGDRLER
ncbi:hypothetical protein HDU76_007175 [Blyttiomyces sp. JEL0837]|nr:hypothetical protein HDU76_007175 [Blyttiomyces sp. JEL0837]